MDHHVAIEREGFRSVVTKKTDEGVSGGYLVLFEVGRVRWTRRVLEHDAISSEDLVVAFSRYVRGDWGEMREDGALHNDLSYTNGGPVIGRYVSSNGVPFLMVTTAKETVVFLPGDESEMDRLLRKSGEPLAKLLSNVLQCDVV